MEHFGAKKNTSRSRSLIVTLLESHWPKDNEVLLQSLDERKSGKKGNEMFAASGRRHCHESMNGTRKRAPHCVGCGPRTDGRGDEGLLFTPRRPSQGPREREKLRKTKPGLHNSRPLCCQVIRREEKPPFPSGSRRPAFPSSCRSYLPRLRFFLSYLTF